jgi:hypothetical protein
LQRLALFLTRAFVSAAIDHIEAARLERCLAHSIPSRSRAMRKFMDPTFTVMERAFQLAKSGSYASVPDIKRRLHAEGFNVEQITGRVLFKQLNTLIQAAQGGTDAQASEPPPVPRQRDRR